MTEPIDFAAAETVATECANARADFKHIQELRNLSRAYLALVKERERLVSALQPFAHFWRQWERLPIRRLDDELYGIHVGTKYEASLRRSDCAEASAALDAAMEASRGA